MQTFAIVATIITTIIAAPQSYGQSAVTYSQPAIIPAYGAASWGTTTQSGSNYGSTTTIDNEVHGGTASNFGQEITNYGATGTNYSNQASTSITVGGSGTQYSSATSTPGYNSYSGGSSGQSSTVGGSVTNFSNTSASGSNTYGGFVTNGVTGNQYTNSQLSSGGSTTATSSNNSASYAGGSSWYKPATSY
ncbi:hypothetical protein CONCODRAFT_4482 [Conidiobolus coronatus NRRL 28638]|uniref:Uncharacterized protein n=1 Tax=Conidiobolus coronatus (strain ATCC 28846 / CBS 209.66 / NRRL 28638) TaxID=796925 RepID=A0A137PC99_CONC2|nr:hypothetical protein CONCODRAFT_4482 [Conidiobolus coronatus NRRL 28638]|eukprot:KXN72629.1 hypothetical protein CONCODRAFT_4482 [Conidiobolus coronatus NRRL 28638]